MMSTSTVALSLAIGEVSIAYMTPNQNRQNTLIKHTQANTLYCLIDTIHTVKLLTTQKPQA